MNMSDDQIRIWKVVNVVRFECTNLSCIEKTERKERRISGHPRFEIALPEYVCIDTPALTCLFPITFSFI